MTCAGSVDCGGGPCSEYLYVGLRCSWVNIHWKGMLCNRLADCAPLYTMAATSCEHTTDLPPGIKRCVYD